MASSSPPVDPRLSARPTAEETREEGVRPVVALPRSGPSGLVIGIAIALAALLLFVVLNARRQSVSQPPVTARSPEATAGGNPPPALYIPPAPAPAPIAVQVAPPRPLPVETAPVRPAPPPPPPPPVIIQQPPVRTAPPPPPMRVSNGPTLVIDTTQAPPTPPAVVQAAQAANDIQNGLTAGQGGGRVRAGVFANRSVTVPQGTLIPAVLETAFDSTRPGFARAVVSRDVRGFDGSRIQIGRAHV